MKTAENNNQTKHTQGKWKLKRTKAKDVLTPIRVVVGDDTIATIEIDVIEDEIEANAKLIVSSPKLLELLNEFVNETKTYINSKEGHGCTWGVKATTLESAQKLIQEINK